MVKINNYVSKLQHLSQVENSASWVHLKFVMLQPGAHNASKTCKQVDKKIQGTVKYCNELYQCTGYKTQAT